MQEDACDDTVQTTQGLYDRRTDPPVLAGWGSGAGGSGLWGYWPCVSPFNYNWAVNPIGFPGCTDCVEGFGHFRLPNAKAIHDYVNGRFYDPTF